MFLSIWKAARKIWEMLTITMDQSPITPTPPPLLRIDKCDSSATRLMLHKFMWFPHKLIDYKLFLSSPLTVCAVWAAVGLILMHFYGVGNIHWQLAARLEKRKLPATIYKLEIRAHIYGKCNSDGFIGRARWQLRKSSSVSCNAYLVKCHQGVLFLNGISHLVFTGNQSGTLGNE